MGAGERALPEGRAQKEQPVNTQDYREWSRRTIHVSSDRSLLGIGADVPNGTVTYGMEVPHEGANLQCNVVIGEWRDPEAGITYDKRCKKRAGHETPKGEERHVPIDSRVVAAPRRVSHSRRFIPSGVPAGVDLSLTADHDCGNHLD
jgi:hypothetical protein